jgi:hypothetical protein
MIAPTKRQRRLQNFGRWDEKNGKWRNDTVRRTHARKFFDRLGHRAPASRLNDAGTKWLGFSKASSRKPLTPIPSWRDFLRTTGIAMWKRQRAEAAIDAELAELEAA